MTNSPINSNNTQDNNSTANQTNNTTQNNTNNNQGNLSISALGIAALVVGVLAAITSIIPFVNNASPFIAIVGLILWLPAFLQVKKGKKRGKGLITTAIVLNVVAIVITLVMQAACSAALNSVSNSNSVTSKTQTQQEQKSNQDYNNLPMGTTISLKKGLDVTVNSVEGGFTNYEGQQLIKVTVTYKNTGSDEESFNTYDWKVEDSQGAQTSNTYYSKGDSSQDLGYGKLAPGGTKTGVVYFKAPAAKIVYGSTIISDSTAKWVIG